MKPLQTLLGVIIGVSLLILATSAKADSIQIISAGYTGQSWEAVLDGYANGQSGTTPNPYGGSPGDAWGVYQEYGWLASKWQRISGGDYDQDLIWINNFNIMREIWGDEYAANLAARTNQYHVEVADQTYDVSKDLEVFVFSTSFNPGNHGIITSDEQSLALIKGIFSLEKITLSGTGSPWKGYPKDGLITLSGTIILGTESYEATWTLVDHPEGNPSVLSVLNDVAGSTQINLANGDPGGVEPLGEIPEPGTLLIFGSAISGLAFLRRRFGKGKNSLA